MTVTPATECQTGPVQEPDDDVTGLVGPVMVAVDISPESRATLVWGCEHASLADAPVTVLHVLHDPAEAPGKYSRNASDPFVPMADTAEQMLAEFMASMRQDHPRLAPLFDARAHVATGLPAQTVVDEAVRHNASLIVVGSRGRGGLPGLVFGSTAEKIVRLSPIPVTVVKGQRS